MFNYNDTVFKTLYVCRYYNRVTKKVGLVTIGVYNFQDFLYLKRFFDGTNIQNLIFLAKKNSIYLTAYICYNVNYLNANIFNEISEMQYKDNIFLRKVIRDKEKMKPFLNFIYPALRFDQVGITNSLYYAKPYFIYNNNIICCWKSMFSNNLSKGSARIQDNYFIYEDKRNVLILKDIAKRHEAIDLYERLAINLQSEEITLQLKTIVNDNIYDGFLIYTNGVWIERTLNTCKIFGFKYT